MEQSYMEEDSADEDEGKLYGYKGDWLTAEQIIDARVRDREMEDLRRGFIRESKLMLVEGGCGGGGWGKQDHQDEKTLNNVADVCRIQYNLIQVAQRVGEPFPEFLELKKLYGRMKGVHKDLCLKKLIGQLSNANGVKNEISSWFLIRMITDLISSVQFKAKMIKFVWNSWLRREYEEVVTKCSFARIQDLVSLTKLLKKKFECSEINYAGHRRFGDYEWARMLGDNLPIRNIQNSAYQDQKDKGPYPQERRRTRSNVVRGTCHFQDSLQTQPKDKRPAATSKMPNESPHQQQLSKLRSLLKEVIHSVTVNNGNYAIEKLSELMQLYNEVNPKVKAESMDDLPRLIRSYMQANGISSSLYFLLTMSHVMAEVKFGKFIMKDLWTSWLRGKYKSTVMQSEINQELISMTKLLGHVYHRVGCANIVSEITGICSNTKWGNFVFSFDQFPGTWERMRYIVMAGGKVKPVPIMWTTSDLLNAQSSNSPVNVTDKPVPSMYEQRPKLQQFPPEAVPSSSVPHQMNYSVPPSYRQKETTESLQAQKPYSRNSRWSESGPTSTRIMQDLSTIPVTSDSSGSHTDKTLKISQCKTPPILLPDDKPKRIAKKKKDPAFMQSHSSGTNLSESHPNPNTYHQPKPFLEIVTGNSTKKDEQRSEHKERKIRKTKSKEKDTSDLENFLFANGCIRINKGSNAPSPNPSTRKGKGEPSQEKTTEEAAKKGSSSQSPAETVSAPASSSKRKRRNPNSIDDILLKPLDPLTIKVSEPSTWQPLKTTKFKRPENTGTDTNQGKSVKTNPISSSEDTAHNHENHYEPVVLPPQKNETAVQQAKRKIERSQMLKVLWFESTGISRSTIFPFITIHWNFSP